MKEPEYYSSLKTIYMRMAVIHEVFPCEELEQASMINVVVTTMQRQPGATVRLSLSGRRGGAGSRPAPPENISACRGYHQHISKHFRLPFISKQNSGVKKLTLRKTLSIFLKTLAIFGIQCDFF